jgi:hypothetical protein
MVKRFKE